MSLPPRKDPLATEKLADQVLADPKASAAQKAAAKKLKGTSIALQIAMMARERQGQATQSGVVDKGPGAKTPNPS